MKNSLKHLIITTPGRFYERRPLTSALSKLAGQASTLFTLELNEITDKKRKI